jgi:hypothetical protein
VFLRLCAVRRILIAVNGVAYLPQVLAQIVFSLALDRHSYEREWLASSMKAYAYDGAGYAFLHCRP